MDKIGRKLGFIFGALMSSATCLVSVFAIIQENFILFCISHLILGLGIAFAHQYRFAAAESVEKEKVPKVRKKQRPEKHQKNECVKVPQNPPAPPWITGGSPNAPARGYAFICRYIYIYIY